MSSDAQGTAAGREFNENTASPDTHLVIDLLCFVVFEIISTATNFLTAQQLGKPQLYLCDKQSRTPERMWTFVRSLVTAAF